MPVLFAGQQNVLRAQYKRLIHNEVTSVKKVDVETASQPDPRFEARTTKTYKQWDDFACSMFHFLSGKTDRMIHARGLPDLVASLGLTPDNAVVVQYVSGETLSVPNPADATTTTNDLVDGDEILWKGEWWTVKLVVPDSEGIQHTVFAVK